MRNIYNFFIIFFIQLYILTGCTTNGTNDVDDLEEKPEKEIESIYDWYSIAQLSQEKLESDFWNKEYNRYWGDNTYTVVNPYQYWVIAHAMESAMDAFERTGELFYKEKVEILLDGIKTTTNGKYINNYYDDMAWMGISCLRAYDIFQDDRYMDIAKILWTDVQKGWVEPNEGMKWNKIPSDSEKRNSCTHWTVADFGVKMFKHTNNNADLSFAMKVYKWAYENLYNFELCAAIDSKDGNVYTTYNQGVLIGSSLGLYELTKREIYLQIAKKCADFCISDIKFGKEGVWRDEGGIGTLNSNNGIFKGILCHYMKNFIVSQYCPEKSRKAYIQYLENMGVILYNATRKDFIFPGDWRRSAYEGECIYLGCQLSGVILMECCYIFSKEFPELLKYTE